MSYLNKKDRAIYDLNRYHIQRVKAIEFLGGACIYCGSVEDLEFDHIDPKTKTFNLGKEWGRADWWAELAKCQLLCHSCHKEKSDREQTKDLHGTWGMIKKKCNCDQCRLFCNAYHKEYKRKKRFK